MAKVNGERKIDSSGHGLSARVWPCHAMVNRTQFTAPVMANIGLPMYPSLLDSSCVKFKAQIQLISLGKQGRVFRNVKTCSKRFPSKTDSELLNQVFSN